MLGDNKVFQGQHLLTQTFIPNEYVPPNILVLEISLVKDICTVGTE